MDIVKLQNDLRFLPPEEFYMKHIIKSHNWYLSEYLQIPLDQLIDKMDLLKEIVSKKFQISFHSSQIVGSAKTGFSLACNKIFMPFHDSDIPTQSSDIDIAIISDEWYFRLWKMAKNTQQIFYKENRSLYHQFANSIFKGFINEKEICGLENLRKIWQEQVDPINKELQDRLGFIHPITYRVYRSWEDLESYQIYSITKAKQMTEA